MISTHRLLLTVIFTITATLAILSSVASITAFTYQNKVAPRTVVAGQSVSNLDKVEAAKLIQAKQSELASQSLELIYGDKTANISLPDLGVTINGPANQQAFAADSNLWNWATPAYWQRFFSAKNIGLSYNIDQIAAKKKIEDVFGVSVEPQDAAIKNEGGQLVIVPSATGQVINLDPILTTIGHFLGTGQKKPLVLQSTSVEPTIGDAAAAQTNTEITAAIQPVYLTGDGKNFTITASQIYDLISYAKDNGRLAWAVSTDKLRDFLSSKVAGKINLKMVQKTILSDTQEVTKEGRDGKSVDLDLLVTAVQRTITEHSSTSATPIEISVKTIAFTEKIVSPDYIAGLYPGLYIDINLNKQRLYIMNGTSKTAEYLISSGKPGTPTPVGVFRIKNKIDLAQSRLFPGIWMKKWNALERKIENDPTTTEDDRFTYEGYGLHEVPYLTINGVLVRESLSHLGRPVSHGCVRIEDVGAAWVYDNAPIGTPVNIHI